MKAILLRTWEMMDYTDDPKKKVKVPAGEYQVERIPNPYGHKNYWLILKGTTTGMSEGSWRGFSGSDIPEYNITLIEEPGDPPRPPRTHLGRLFSRLARHLKTPNLFISITAFRAQAKREKCYG